MSIKEQCEEFVADVEEKSHREIIELTCPVCRHERQATLDMYRHFTVCCDKCGKAMRWLDDK